MYQCFYCPCFCCNLLLGSLSVSKGCLCCQLGSHLAFGDYVECCFDFLDFFWILEFLVKTISLCIYPPMMQASDFNSREEGCRRTCYPCSRALKIDDETYIRSCSSCAGCTSCLISFCFMPVYCRALNQEYIDRKIYLDPYTCCIPRPCTNCMQLACKDLNICCIPRPCADYMQPVCPYILCSMACALCPIPWVLSPLADVCVLTRLLCTNREDYWNWNWQTDSYTVVMWCYPSAILRACYEYIYGDDDD